MDLTKIDLSSDLGGLKLANPVIAASGTFGYGLEYTDFVDLNRLGGFCTKGLSLQPRIGCAGPRVIETPSGMLNAIGLENIGFEKFVQEKIPVLRNYKAAVIVNFFGERDEEYLEMARALSEIDRVDALEMNISCPNVAEGGNDFSQDALIAAKLIRKVRKATDQFLIVKLSPNVTDITKIARAVEGEGADAVSLINTLVGMAIDRETGKPYLGNKTGGLSGPAIKPLALRMVYETVKAVKIPVIGIGGIQSAEDVIEFLMVGAKAIQIGTANFIEPAATMNILDDLESYCWKNKLLNLSEIGNDRGYS